MTRTTIVIAAALALAVTLPAVPANAQLARSFVSAAGIDSNNCANVATPCRHFATAYAATAPNGEIYVLDPANYGSLTITHAVSIQGHGWGSVSAPAGGTAIIINAGPNDAVNLSGLTIDGTGIGAWGIVFNSGASLVIENCVARNHTSSGIGLQPAAPARIAVSNTIVANNGVHGIYLQPSGSGNVNAVFNRVEAYSNGQEGIGIFGNVLSSGGSVWAKVVDSVAAYNNDGFYALGRSDTHNVALFVFRSTTMVNNRAGLYVDQGAAGYPSRSNFSGDNWVQVNGNCIFSTGDNDTSSASAPCGSTSRQ
jgi:hypothetical protein